MNLNRVKRIFICSWCGHKIQERKVFKIEKTITLHRDEVIDGSIPNALEIIAERYKDYGHIQKYKFCSRCGLEVEMAGGTLFIRTGTFVDE